MSDHLPKDAELRRLDLLQADLDDESPEILGSVADSLFTHGALDVVFLSTQMKKSRPGTRLEALCDPAKSEELIGLVLRSTSTLGVRKFSVERYCLSRKMDSIQLGGHEIRVKVALWNGAALKAKAEFEDLRRAAEALDRTVKSVANEARALIYQKFGV